MGGLWRRRAARQMVYGLIPLLAIGAAMVVVLIIHLGHVAAPVNAATQTTRATVVASQLGADHHEIDLSWTDNRSARHTSRLRFPGSGKVTAGTTVDLHYNPDDVTQVFVNGDAASTRVRDLTTDVGVVFLVTLAALVATAVRTGRRRLAERRPATDRRMSVSHSRRGLTTRTWLTETDAGQTWWQPVYWDPALDTLDPDRPYPVHGAANPRAPRVVEIDGTPIWPAGRRRTRAPRGELTRADGPRDEPRRVSLRRHLVGDLPPVFAAPLLGLLWAYFDNAGSNGFWASTVVLAGVLFWLPSVYASDPVGPE
ncbi:MAG TPA: hypothetical protein VFX70_04830, partial [Mycobacteriales bacterium]|nr:hypothetical protein [Mycobacteriales bacterium]